MPRRNEPQDTDVPVYLNGKLTMFTSYTEINPMYYKCRIAGSDDDHYFTRPPKWLQKGVNLKANGHAYKIPKQ